MGLRSTGPLSDVVHIVRAMLLHEQVTLPDGVDVDRGIADLITALWELGLRTSNSCQGTPGGDEGDRNTDAAYILFPEAVDAYSFFSRALETISTPDSLAQIVVSVRLLARGGTPDAARKRGKAVSLELGVDPREGARDLRGCVRFDPELVPRVEAAFAAHGKHAPHPRRQENLP